MLTLPVLLQLLKNKYVQMALEIGAIVVVALVIRAHYINIGKAQGQDQAKQQQSQDIEALRKTAEQSLKDATAGAIAQIQAAQARADAAAQVADRQAQVILALAGQSRITAQTVAQIPDSDLHQFNVRTMAVRAPADTTPGYTANEERAIATCTTQWPICEKQRDAQTAELAATRDQVKAVQDKQAATDQEIQAWHTYAAQLTSYYTLLWNQHPPKYRSPICVWMWKCGTRRLATPPPGEIREPDAVPIVLPKAK